MPVRVYTTHIRDFYRISASRDIADVLAGAICFIQPLVIASSQSMR